MACGPDEQAIPQPLCARIEPANGALPPPSETAQALRWSSTCESNASFPLALPDAAKRPTQKVPSKQASPLASVQPTPPASARNSVAHAKLSEVPQRCPGSLLSVDCARGPSSFAVASLLHVDTWENKKLPVGKKKASSRSEKKIDYVLFFFKKNAGSLADPSALPKKH